MAGKLLKIGGAEDKKHLETFLGPGQHTSVLVLIPKEPGGVTGLMDIAYGQTVVADRIHHPEGYVERGQGVLIDPPKSSKKEEE